MNTCTNHNDRQRAECTVCLVAALTAECDELRDKVKSLKKQIKDDNFSYGCELRDPYGTIWEQATKDHARAERAEAELAAERDQLRAEVERRNDIINRASVQFFHDGSDGETAAKMLTVLNEAKA